eukprot:TRINITY_DN2034_c0_g1_i1.p1 TRINITY_DN2034_c0_g1~~TRINITY_DN2034_c0_g1_i1.p1  ORF type:complete len:609 (+),score=166.41 TRINITY_DN2034_c0_g1_i1:94-1920(+)
MAWGPKQAASKTARTPGEPPTADSPSLSGEAFPSLGGGGSRRQAPGGAAPKGAWGAASREAPGGTRGPAPQPQKSKEEETPEEVDPAEQQQETAQQAEEQQDSWGEGSWQRWKEEERPEEKLQEGGEEREERPEAAGEDSTEALLQRLEPLGGASAFLTVTAGLDLAALLGLLHVIRGDSGPDGLDVAAWEELAAMVQRFGGPRAVLDLLEVEKVHAAVVEALSGGSSSAAGAEAACQEDPAPVAAQVVAEQSKEDQPLLSVPSVEPTQGAPWESAADPAPAPAEAAPKSSWAAMVSSNAPSAAAPTKAAPWAGKGAPGKGGPSLPPHPSTPAPRPPGEPPRHHPPPEAAPQQPAWPTASAPGSAPAWGPQSKAPQQPPDGYAPGLEAAPAWGPAPTSPPTVAPAASKWLSRVGVVKDPPAAPPPKEEDEAVLEAGDAEEDELKIDEQEPPWEEQDDEVANTVGPSSTGFRETFEVVDVQAKAKAVSEEADAAVEAEEQVPASACEEEPAAAAGGPGPALALASGQAKEPKLAGTKLSEWLRRRVFQLRVTLPIGHSELLEVLQSLDDEKLQPPFEEAKLWLGFDDADSLPKGLEQLMTDFRDVRVRP